MKAHKWFTPWLLVAPAVIWVLVFGIWPFVRTIVLSFTDARPLRAGEFVGWENYTRMFSDEQFGYALTTSFIYMIVCVPLLTILPLLLALLVEKTIPWITFFRTTFYFPVIASVVVVALIWTWMFDTRGLVNGALDAMGFVERPIPFLVDRWWLLACSILLTVWKGLGYYMVVYLAALGNSSKELHEAAALDGAGTFRRFLTVTVPAVRGAMVLIMALVAVSALRIFTELHVLSNGTGGPGGQDMSLVMLIKMVGSGLNGNVGYASALSVVMFLITALPLLAIAWMNREKEGKA